MKSKIVILLLINLLAFPIVFGQKNNKKISISGIVRDDALNPITGALIFVDNLNTGVVTNNKGIYKIKVSPANANIQVFTTSNGVGSQAIEGKTRIDFSLAPSSAPADQLQGNTGRDEAVNIGYGAVKKKDLTTSVNKISGDDNKYSAYRSVYEILEEVPGVKVSGKSIQIQGPTSINSSNEPLLVVDGMVVSSIDDISPITIESISVLKGASTAIYGSRGANGVVLINLKKGKSLK